MTASERSLKWDSSKFSLKNTYSNVSFLVMAAHKESVQMSKYSFLLVDIQIWIDFYGQTFN